MYKLSIKWCNIYFPQLFCIEIHMENKLKDKIGVEDFWGNGGAMVLNSEMEHQKHEVQSDEWKTRKSTFTSTCPLKAAWCNAVLPARSDTFTLLRRGTKASAHFTALFAAAMCRGVCQFLSRALTSAECFNNTWTASWKHLEKKPSHLAKIRNDSLRFKDSTVENNSLQFVHLQT